MSNLKLWESVQATDPKYTKRFTKGGGFSGTAINATHLAQKATEIFGPCGTGWGIDVVDEQFVEGAPLVIDGVVVGHDVIHKLRIKLWYVRDGARGEITHFGQTQFVGKNKNGFYTDEEAPKKSLTDAMTKALSLLGFASDVHLGLYDDNKYVESLAEMFKEPAPKITPEQAKEIEKKAQDLGADWSGFLSFLKVESIADLDADKFDRAMKALDKKKAA